MGMKPSVSDDGSIQKQIGSAYDVVKSVADNLPSIYAVLAAVDNITGSFVLQSTTVNNKPLTGNINLTADDVGARIANWVPSWSEILNKPTTLSDYGITDAQPASSLLNTFNNNVSSATLGIFKKTAAGVWSFASLLDTDIPNLNASKITAGTLAVARGGTGRTDNKTVGLATPVTITVGSTGKSFDGTAALSWNLTEIGAQAVNANLSAFSGLTGVADRLAYFTGAGTLSLATFTAFGRSIVAAADAAAVNTLLGKTTADLTIQLFRRATVDLDFASALHRTYSNKYMLQQPLQDAVTTVRATTATADHPFGVVTYDANEPRMQYDATTGEPLGLLCEKSRTNLLFCSQEFDNAVWTKRGGSTITPNTTIAPDGTLTADTHVSTDTVQNGSYIRYLNAFTTDNTVYCGSAFFKRGSQPQARIVMYAKLGTTHYTTIVYNFDADTVSIVNTGSVTGVLAGRIKYPNGWVRVWASFNCLAGTEVAGFNVIPSMWGIPTAVGSEFGYVWGAQVEVGSYPTSYNPTLSSATTSRTYDETTVNGVVSDLSTATEYTIFADYTVLDSSSGVLFGLGNTFDNTVYCTVNTPFFMRSGGAGGPSCPTNQVAVGVRYKQAIKIKSGDYACYRNGVALFTSTSVFAVPASISRVKLGSAPWETSSSSSNQSSVVFHRFTIIPRALTAAELQAITS